MPLVNEETLTGLAGVAADFAEEAGGGPTLAEFLEVVGWSIPADSDLPVPLRFKATLKGNKRYESTETSRVPELNDHVFEDVRSVLANVDIPLADALLEAIQSGRIPLTDVNGEDVRKLTVDAKRATKPKPGDVIGIPAGEGGYRLAVVLGQNSFGTAIGLFDGVSAQGRLEQAIRDNPRKHPVYTEESLIKDGTWKILGHDDGLTSLFPSDPPIYHKAGAFPGVDTGEFGAAETADGDMRMLSQAEASEVGLLDGTYRQVYPAAYLQKVLDEA